MDKTNDERKYCVYCHLNKINNKAYIGITKQDVKVRWGAHGSHYGKNTHFGRAIQKYGWDNFEHIILFENLTKKEACKKEIWLIALFGTQNPELGYNISPGGDLGWTGCHLSDETKQKISESHKGLHAGEKNPMYGVSPKERMDEETYNRWKEKVIAYNTSDESRQNRREKNIGKKYSAEINAKKGKQGSDHPMYGKHHTEETKRKISESNIGRTQSEEARKKISDATRGEKNPFYGKTHSEESKRKMSEALKGRPSPNKGKPLSDAQKARLSEVHRGKTLSNETRAKMSAARQGAKNSTARKVVQYDLDGNFIRAWDYIKQAAIELNINRCCIGDCCRGVQKTAGGFLWKYFIEEEIENVQSACV